MVRARSHLSRLVAVIAFVFLPASAAHGQTPVTGAVTGVVTDTAGLPLNDVLVTLMEPATGTTRATRTTADGRFILRFLLPGEYEVRLEKIGYAPVRVTHIPVRPGRGVQMEDMLPLVSVPSPPWQTRRFDGATLNGARAGAGQWLTHRLVETTPLRSRNATGLTTLTSLADENLQSVGLPSSFSLVQLDGVPFRPSVHQRLRTDVFRMTGVTQLGVEQGMLAVNAVDVEWPGAAGGILSLHSPRGTDTTRFDAFARWSGGALPGVSAAVSDLSFTDILAGARIQGPLFGDSAGFALGIEARRLQVPHSAALPDNSAADQFVRVAGERSFDLGALQEPVALADEAITAFGRLDWAVSPKHQLDASFSFASLPAFGVVDRATGLVSELEGADLLAGLALRSGLRSGVSNELRASFTSSRRTSIEFADAPPTYIVHEGLAAGGGSERARGTETQLRITEALHLQRGAHTLKLGGALQLGTWSIEQRDRATNEFFFGSANAFAADSGVFTGVVGPAPVAKWTTPTLGGFIQDSWNPGEGIDLVIGVNVDRQSLPSDDVSRDAEWARLTGISNDTVRADEASLRVSPAVALTWDVRREHRWILHAGGAVSFDQIDPLLIAEWHTDDGPVRIRRGVGSLSWPGTSTGSTAQHLTVLSPGFAAPVSARFTGGIMYRLSGRSALHMSGAIRRTENLPRRNDLNLLPEPAARDQFGRAVFGTLVKQGGLLAAEPGSNRRFSDYDEVAVITSDGISEYWGITAGFEHTLSESLAATVRYTFSNTQDNWFAGDVGGWTVPLPQGLGNGPEWADGTSDFDVPHRVAAALVYEAPFGLTVSGRVRHESGRPFTPGFRLGVDADGDGSARNDPAFVDENVPGMDALIASWPCLRESSGQIVERNACRTDAVNNVDLGVSFRVARLGGLATSLTLEAFDLLDEERIVPDAALYLIDPVAELTRNTAARTITVPLVANENFGQSLTRRHTGRQLRLGLTLNW